MDIVEKRKNMAQYGDGDSGNPCKVVNSGVDLNRNFGYDFKLQFAQDSRTSLEGIILAPNSTRDPRHSVRKKPRLLEISLQRTKMN